MGLTMAEKILSKASNSSRVQPGEIIQAKVDLVMVHDLTGPLAIKAMNEIGVEKVWDPEKIVVVLDHQVPADKIGSANLHVTLRKFVKKHRIRNFYDIGRGGICHQVLAERGHVLPGQLVIGADSHTCTLGALGAFATGVGSTDAAAAILAGEIWMKVPESMKISVYGDMPPLVSAKDLILKIIGDVGSDGATYKAVEFAGETIRSMNMAGRMTLCNMAVEMGAKTGMVAPDEATISYLGHRDLAMVKADRSAEYYEIREYDASKLTPMVACPPRVDKVKPVSEVEEVEVNQVFIGSCTNGRVEDIVEAVKIIKGRKIADDVRCIVIPASVWEYEKALNQGLIQELVKAGCYVCPPTCGPCLGGHMGVLGEGEIAVSTSNRNFIGRMGHKSSKVYIVSPTTAAATAITGRLTDPRELKLGNRWR